MNKAKYREGLCFMYVCFMYVCYMSLEKVVKTTYQFVNMVIGEGRGSEVREISADGRRKAKLQWGAAEQHKVTQNLHCQ